MYRVRVRANESPSTREVWFGVFAERDRPLRPDSPFGTHVTSMVSEPGNTLLWPRRQWERAGCGCTTSETFATGGGWNRRRAASSGTTGRLTRSASAGSWSSPTLAIRHDGQVAIAKEARVAAPGLPRSRATGACRETTSLALYIRIFLRKTGNFVKIPLRKAGFQLFSTIWRKSQFNAARTRTSDTLALNRNAPRCAAKFWPPAPSTKTSPPSWKPSRLPSSTRHSEETCKCQQPHNTKSKSAPCAGHAS